MNKIKHCYSCKTSDIKIFKWIGGTTIYCNNPKCNSKPKVSRADYDMSVKAWNELMKTRG